MIENPSKRDGKRRGEGLRVLPERGGDAHVFTKSNHCTGAKEVIVKNIFGITADGDDQWGE